jgi:hypothetical protein
MNSPSSNNYLIVFFVVSDEIQDEMLKEDIPALNSFITTP